MDSIEPLLLRLRKLARHLFEPIALALSNACNRSGGSRSGGGHSGGGHGRARRSNAGKAAEKFLPEDIAALPQWGTSQMGARKKSRGE